MRTIEVHGLDHRKHTIVVESIDSFCELNIHSSDNPAKTEIIYHSGSRSITLHSDEPYGMIETKVHGYYLHEDCDSPCIQALLKERKEYLARTESHVGPDQHIVLTEDVPSGQERREGYGD